ncbi:DUF805 domain-containing protein [Acidocella sp.]|uniref:DUF805 domain-containing protein n=1 Tax=Acidocella sp. TaxID=50710 RepID=UPI003D01C8A3
MAGLYGNSGGRVDKGFCACRNILHGKSFWSNIFRICNEGGVDEVQRGGGGRIPKLSQFLRSGGPGGILVVFLWYILIWFVAGLFLVAAMVMKAGHSGVLPLTVLAGLFGLAGLGTILPALAVQVRRLHDVGHSGWWVGVELLLSLGRGVLYGLAHHFPALGVELAFLALGVMWFGVSITIFVFLVQPSRHEGRFQARD